MKSIVLLVVVSVFVSAVFGQQFTEEQKKKIIQNRNECIAETKVNPELIEKADQGDFSEDGKLKCFTKCFYQKAGFVNKDGEVQVDVIKVKISSPEDQKLALHIVDKCQLKGEDACDTVYKIHKCYYEFTHPQPTQATTAATESKKN